MMMKARNWWGNICREKVFRSVSQLNWTHLSQHKGKLRHSHKQLPLRHFAIPWKLPVSSSLLAGLLSGWWSGWLRGRGGLAVWERASQSVILRSQHSYTTTQQWASAAAAADLHSTGLAQPAWPALGRTLLGSEELSRHLPCLPCLYQPRTHCQTPLSLLEGYLTLSKPQGIHMKQDIQNRLFWNWNQYYKI